jgi:hypothetical protein
LTESARSGPVSANVPSRSNMIKSMGRFIELFLWFKNKPQTQACQFSFSPSLEEDDI